MKKKLSKEIIEKERTMRHYIEDNFNDKELDILTQDDWKKAKATKQQLGKFMELVWFNLGKKEAEEKELKKGISDIITFLRLIYWERNGCLTYRRGYWKRTKLGEDFLKELKLNDEHTNSK